MNPLPLRSSFHLIAAFAVLSLVPMGCSTPKAFVLDSDLPVPSDTVARVTTDVEREGGRLVRLNTVFAGTVNDPSRRLKTLETRFQNGGWVSLGPTATGSTAVCFFTKSSRRCQVRVVRNELDPAMSRIAYRLVPIESDRGASGDSGPTATSAESDLDG